MNFHRTNKFLTTIGILPKPVPARTINSSVLSFGLGLIMGATATIFLWPTARRALRDVLRTSITPNGVVPGSRKVGVDNGIVVADAQARS